MSSGVNKKQKGFSYTEILMALALFSILVITVLPSVVQFSRNSALAQSYYNSHLGAQSIMLAVRDALSYGYDIFATAAETAAAQNVDLYRVFIFDESTVSFGTYNAPGLNASILTNFAPVGINATFVVVFVLNDEGGLMARAIGVANERLNI